MQKCAGFCVPWRTCQSSQLVRPAREGHALSKFAEGTEMHCRNHAVKGTILRSGEPFGGCTALASDRYLFTKSRRK